MKLFRGLYAQAGVIHALVLRETRTRFGAHHLGYLWALVEPTLMITTFWVMYVLGGRSGPFGMDLFGFMATGFLPYLLFSSTVTRVAESINGNKALLYYPQVHPLDLVFARTILETVTYTGVFMVLMFANTLYLQHFVIDSALLILAGFALAAALGASLGLVFCALGQFSNAFDRVRGPLMRPLFWISGAFFAAESLPGKVREVMLTNPVLHTVEMTRAGWYPSYRGQYADASYVLIWILVFAVIGLSLEQVVRRRIEVT